MKIANRTIQFDRDLNIEATRFWGYADGFPEHFHDHYVLGSIVSGCRSFTHRRQKILLKKDYFLFLAPMESHSCMPVGNGQMDFWGLNIPQNVMMSILQEITETHHVSSLASRVFYDAMINHWFRKLHTMIFDASDHFEKEEILFLLISLLLKQHSLSTTPATISSHKYANEIYKTCAYLNEYYARHISLQGLCARTHLSRSTFLRAFTYEIGITPYRYLESVRINHSKKMLEHGIAPSITAIATGYSDQSHFTNYFTSFTGVSPCEYQNIFYNTAERTKDK